MLRRRPTMRPRTELSAAQVAYNKLLTSASAQAVLKARAALAVAQERVQVAQES